MKPTAVAGCIVGIIAFIVLAIAMVIGFVIVGPVIHALGGSLL